MAVHPRRAGPTGQRSPNPLLDLHTAADGDPAERDRAISLYGFAVPTAEALDAVAGHAPGGVVEVGAGPGYWAHLLAEQGVDVVAYDADPPPSATNPWFAGAKTWYPIRPGDETVVDDHADRTLLLVWPTSGALWAATAVERFHRAGGERLAYVGEGPGGATGDDRFHALLGAITHCQPCTYGVTNAACTCDVVASWKRFDVIELPQWRGHDDRLELYTAVPPQAGPDATHRPRFGLRRSRR